MTHPHPRALEAAARAVVNQWKIAESDMAAFTPNAIARAAVTAYLAALQDTHALVPREATVGMYRALTHSWPDDLQKGVWLLGSFAEDYRAMIDAAPPAAQEKK